jgi:hypothetical protein
MPVGPRPFPPNRTAKVVFGGTYAGSQWVNVMWLYLTGSGEIEQSVLQELANGLSGEYGGQLQVLKNEADLFTYTQVTLYFNDEAFDAYELTAIAGTASEGALPASVACCVSWKVAAHYRGGHARTYLSGQDSGSLGNVTTWAGGFITNVNTNAAAFHDGVEGLTPGDGITSVEHGVVSFINNSAWRDPPVFRRIITGTADSRVDTQRRRLGPDRPF